VNVFEYRKYKEHEDKIHMIISKYFPYTASMTEQFFNDAEFNEIYLKHYHYCFLRDTDYNVKGCIAYYLYDEIFEDHPEEADKYDIDMRNRVYVSLLEVRDEYRGHNIGFEMIELLQDKFSNKKVCLTAKNDELLHKYYLKDGKFILESGRELIYKGNYN